MPRASIAWRRARVSKPLPRRPGRSLQRPDAPAFALALQWHPEHRALENPISMKLFDAFATACRSRAAARFSPPLRAAAE
jgi:hypothetical protein